MVGFILVCMGTLQAQKEHVEGVLLKVYLPKWAKALGVSFDKVKVILSLLCSAQNNSVISQKHWQPLESRDKILPGTFTC